jgi:hypothetical protein
MWVGNSSNAPVQVIGTVARLTPSTFSASGGSISGVTIGNSSASSATLPTSLTLAGTTISTLSTDNTLGSGSNSVLPTASASKLYSDNNLAGRLKNIYSYTTAGTYTYTKSGSDVAQLNVICVGAGGGARAYAESGGAGGYAEGVFAASGITTVTVTVGGGGGGGVYFGFSGQGGTSSFGGYISASGGYGSSNNVQHSGGHGGYGFGGAINAYGGQGGSHNNQDQYSTTCASSSQGGASFFGGAGESDRPDFSLSFVGAAGTGGVAIAPSHNGQGGRSGQSGAVIVYEYR